MQKIRVLSFDQSDFVHSDETVELDHISSRTKYTLLVKDLNNNSNGPGTTGIMIPLDNLQDIDIGNGYLSLILSNDSESQQSSVILNLSEYIEQYKNK
ncbi:MAG: hypothetical protein CL780_06410 [Chloroflexi bacterium]|nr:hypothetical protein [Chloroflexota bacterium]|tara:strand:- start:44327 stop:44620 length:294 start_codon:yes stop_codon:yes gene_type:complete